jgi:hypothetical protein
MRYLLTNIMHFVNTPIFSEPFKGDLSWKEDRQ